MIFNHSVVNDIKQKDDEYITYTDMHQIKSKYVVICTHYPFINFPGFYFSKMYQVTSYALAIETNQTSAKYNNKDLLILSGGDHKTGYSPDSESFYGYKYIENEAKKYYPNSKILYKWNTRDCITLDKIPYIGKFSEFTPNMYVATGFNKWGMTSSNVAGNIITDAILEAKNEYAKIYDSTRFEPIKNKDELKNMTKQVFQSFISNRIKIPSENLSAIKNDNGGIIKLNGTSVGIYKDKTGNIYAVNPTCTHLGCLLTWNNLDKTWDCPCHGSRFDFSGKNIYDPAFKDLKKYEIID